MLTVDTAIRWWATITIVIAAPVIGGFMENLSVLSPAFDFTGECELPLLTQAFLPAIAYSTELGFAVAAVSLLALLAAFKVADSEVVKYRAVTVVSISAWAIIVVGTLQAFLALFVLPVAKCGGQ